MRLGEGVVGWLEEFKGEQLGRIKSELLFPEVSNLGEGFHLGSRQLVQEYTCGGAGVAQR